jgi:hypothetical protein
MTNTGVGAIIQTPLPDWNLLPLESWRDSINYHPYHFWGLGGQIVPVTSNCNSIVPQYGYQQADVVGRHGIRSAIQTAEERIEPHLGFYPAPRYCEDTVAWPAYPKVDVHRLGYAGANDRWLTVNVPHKHVQTVGVEKIVAVGLASVVTLSDANGDGLVDKFTVTANAPVGLVDLTQIVVYFSAADRFTGDSFEERWRIAPIRTSLSGGVLTITGPAWLLVKPILYESMALNPLDAADTTNYASTLDVCWRYPYTEGTTLADASLIFIWQTPPYPMINYNIVFASTDPAGYAWAIGRATLTDSVNGVLGIGESCYNATTGAWDAVPWYSSIYKFRQPDRVIVRYLAGFPLDKSGRMSSNYATAVSRLAAAEMPNRICACDSSNRELARWQFDLARSAGANDEAYGYISREDLGNPFGTRRGQVEAWKFVKPNRVLTAYMP